VQFLLASVTLLSRMALWQLTAALKKGKVKEDFVLHNTEGGKKNPRNRLKKTRTFKKIGSIFLCL